MSSLLPTYTGVCPQWPHTPSWWSGIGSPGKLLISLTSISLMCMASKGGHKFCRNTFFMSDFLSILGSLSTAFQA